MLRNCHSIYAKKTDYESRRFIFETIILIYDAMINSDAEKVLDFLIKL